MELVRETDKQRESAKILQTKLLIDVYFIVNEKLEINMYIRSGYVNRSTYIPGKVVGS